MVELNTQMPQIPIANAQDSNLSSQTNPVLPTTPAEHIANADGAIGVVRKDLNEKSLTKITRAGVSVAELIAATPLVLTSLLNQADNIAKFGASAKDEGAVGFLSSVIESLSLPFRAGLNFISLVHDHSPLDALSLAFSSVTSKSIQNKGDDIKVNKRPFILVDVYQRLLHPSIAKEFTSFLFTFRRSIFNFFPKVFQVPSEEHDPYHAVGKKASAVSTNFLVALSTITSPIRFFTSSIGLFLLSPMQLLSSIYAYTGNQKQYEATKEFSAITDYFSPIIANLSSTFSTAKAYWDSYTKGESTLVTFGKYNLSPLNLIQGIFGSVLSIPQFFGALSKVKTRLGRKDENSELKILTHVRNFVGEIVTQLKSLNMFKNNTVAGVQNNVDKFLKNLMYSTSERLTNFTDSLFNASPFLQSIFGSIRARDIEGNVLVNSDVTSIEPNDSKDKYFAGALKKTHFFSEVYDLLQPVQSLLMLLPNVFVPIGDPYITDNAKAPFRILDRMLGINSMILSVPNYFIYALSTRVPQMILKFFEIKQRKADLAGDKQYDAYQNYQALINNVGNIPFFGTSYLAKILAKIEVEKDVFKDNQVMSATYDKLESDAKEQESTVKSSELISAMRIGMRTLLNNKWFSSERDKETGLTAEEKSRNKIYGSLGTLKEGIARIPVLGWIAAPFIEMFRGMYKVDTQRRRKTLPGNQMQSVTPSAAPSAEQLAALMKNMGQQPA